MPGRPERSPDAYLWYESARETTRGRATGGNRSVRYGQWEPLVGLEVSR
jgi:hypothetical protein